MILRNYFSCEQGESSIRLGPTYWPYTLPLCRNQIEESSDNIKKMELPDDVYDPVSRGRARKTFKEIKQHCTAFEFLPSKKHTPLVRLIYLTTLNGQKSPYTKEQYLDFQRSFRADLLARRVLQWGVPLLCISMVVGAVLTIKAIVDELDNDDVAIYAFFFVIQMAFFFITCIAYVATGTNPDASSNLANARQDRVHFDVKETYYELALKLVKLGHKNKKLAKIIADRLPFDQIKYALKRDDPKMRYPVLLNALIAGKYALFNERTKLRKLEISLELRTALKQIKYKARNS